MASNHEKLLFGKIIEINIVKSHLFTVKHRRHKDKARLFCHLGQFHLVTIQISPLKAVLSNVTISRQKTKWALNKGAA